MPMGDGARLIDVPADKVYATTGHIFAIGMTSYHRGVGVRIGPPLCDPRARYVGHILTELPKLLAKMSEEDRKVFLGELSMLALAGAP
jgi:hypothetical protein